MKKFFFIKILLENFNQIRNKFMEVLQEILEKFFLSLLVIGRGNFFIQEIRNVQGCQKHKANISGFVPIQYTHMYPIQKYVGLGMYITVQFKNRIFVTSKDENWPGYVGVHCLGCSVPVVPSISPHTMNNNLAFALH